MIANSDCCKPRYAGMKRFDAGYIKTRNGKASTNRSPLPSDDAPASDRRFPLAKIVKALADEVHFIADGLPPSSSSIAESKPHKHREQPPSGQGVAVSVDLRDMVFGQGRTVYQVFHDQDRPFGHERWEEESEDGEEHRGEHEKAGGETDIGVQIAVRCDAAESFGSARARTRDDEPGGQTHVEKAQAVVL